MPCDASERQRAGFVSPRGCCPHSTWMHPGKGALLFPGWPLMTQIQDSLEDKRLLHVFIDQQRKVQTEAEFLSLLLVIHENNNKAYDTFLL